jgi:outer membrane protein OmpA-like peptidoglycan-associated protein
MNTSGSRKPFERVLLLALTLAVSAAAAFAQSDLQRETVAITYPVDDSVNVRFRGTTRLPRLTGEAKVTRTGRRGTRVELAVKNLPRAFELGGVYTTYVLWAVTPEGRTDNLGEIKRDGSFLSNSKLDVTTPLQTFAMLVTAEPHFLVRGPSRMVVLENLPPNKPGDADVATVAVRYIGNASDYFNQTRVPDLADQDYVRTPVPVLGARQSLLLARFAGAERDAPAELKKAADLLAEAENLWRLKAPDTEIEAKAREAIDAGVTAEEAAQSRRGARQRREEIARRDAAVREAEKSADTAAQEIVELRRALERSERARELSDRDVANTNQQLRDLRSENARLRDELQQARAESQDVKVRLARLEGERAAEDARRSAEQWAAQQQQQAASLRQSLSRFGTLRDASGGMTLTLPDTLWSGARSADFSAAASSTLEPLAALLANNPGYQIYVEAYTDNRGDDATLRRLAQDRAAALASHLSGAGVDNARIQASGMGPEKPVAPNATPAGRARNRRVEITLVAAEQNAGSTPER